MARNPKYDILFEPLRIGPKVMKNRFYQTPHCSGLGSEYPGAQAYLRGTKAEGGWAVVHTEYCSIHPEDDDWPYVAARIWDEDDVRNLSLLCDQAHAHGALAGIQLHYGGSHGSNYDARMVSRVISQIPSETYYWHSGCEMDKHEIRELQEFYVAAAVRARSAGFDIVQIMGREAVSIPVHFLMPWFNKRTDEYGGSFENRARFFLETLERVREAVGDDCAVTAGFSIDTLADGDAGIRVDEEAVAFIELADHLVDLWDLQVGGRTIGEWIDDAAPSRFREENWQGHWLRKIRPHTVKPIVGVGRFTNPDTMVAVIESGQQDVIGAARPSIADPYLPKKIEEGRLDDIRECIGCNACVSRFSQGGARIICTQNATIGEEYRRGWHPERFSKASNADNDVLIVGAGPAGMECARVLGERGMRRIHLVDAEPEMGGIMRWVPTLPGLGEWSRVLNYRQIQLDKLRNVEFIPKTQLSAAEIADYGAEIVVLATGATWATNGLNGCTHKSIPGADASLAHIATPDQIMAKGKEVPGDRVIVYDCEGYFVAASLAERLARQGKVVTYVTPYGYVAPYTTYTGEATHINRVFADLGITVHASHVIERIDGHEVVACQDSITSYAGFQAYVPEHPTVSWEVDSIVLATQRVSNDALYRSLTPADGWHGQMDHLVYRVGDCVSPRIIAECVFDGHRLAREIDSNDPSKPLAFIRERRVLGASDEDFDGIIDGDRGGHKPSSRPSVPDRIRAGS